MIPHPPVSPPTQTARNWWFFAALTVTNRNKGFAERSSRSVRNLFLQLPRPLLHSHNPVFLRIPPESLSFSGSSPLHLLLLALRCPFWNFSLAPADGDLHHQFTGTPSTSLYKTVVSGVAVSPSRSSLHPSSSFLPFAFHEASLVASCSSCIVLGDSRLTSSIESTANDLHDSKREKVLLVRLLPCPSRTFRSLQPSCFISFILISSKCTFSAQVAAPPLIPSFPAPSSPQKICS